MVMLGSDYQREARISSDELKGQLICLWETVFGDAPDYISLFLDSSAFRPEDTVVSLDGGKLAAMLFLLPVGLGGLGKMRGRYIYAVATHPHFRRRGYAGAMLEFARQLTEQRGDDFTCLHPASSSLYGFYRKLGFETAFYTNETVRSVQGRQDAFGFQIGEAPEGKFRSLYLDASLKRRENFLLWKEETLSFIYQEAKAQDGGVLSINGTGFCLYTCPEKETVIVKELAFAGGISDKLLDELAGFWPGKTVKFRLPADFSEKKVKTTVLQPFGMIKYRKGLSYPALDKSGLSPAFMGIALD